MQNLTNVTANYHEAKASAREIPSSDEAEMLLHLKCNLLSKGVASVSYGTSPVETPLRTQSGVSGGLDVQLPFDVFVNIPFQEIFCRNSPYSIKINGSTSVLFEDGIEILPVKVLPAPAYYETPTADGRLKMAQVGRMCSGDRFWYGMTDDTCLFWRKDRRCRFCSIGTNPNGNIAALKSRYLIEVLEAAVAESEFPARHILIGGGTPSEPDMGALLASKLCYQLKKRFPQMSLYIMIAAPLDNCYIDALADAGADELAMNLEFWGDAAWSRFIPGKQSVIGKRRYLQALEYSVKKLGPVNTRTVFVFGLESMEETIAGVRAASELGVMPILSPFRPTAGSMLERHAGPTAEACIELFKRCKSVCDEAKMPLGPTCVCCQNNVIALPFGPGYKYY